MKRIAAAIVLTMVVPWANAQDDFKCVIKETMSVADDGTFQDSSTIDRLGGQEFVVSRQTGRIVGALHNDELSDPEVMDRGGEDADFKVISLIHDFNSEDGTVAYVIYLQVKTQVEGDDKPFYFFTTGLGLFTGICTAY